MVGLARPPSLNRGTAAAGSRSRDQGALVAVSMLFQPHLRLAGLHSHHGEPKRPARRHAGGGTPFCRAHDSRCHVGTSLPAARRCRAGRWSPARGLHRAIQRPLCLGCGVLPRTICRGVRQQGSLCGGSRCRGMGGSLSRREEGEGEGGRVFAARVLGRDCGSRSNCCGSRADCPRPKPQTPTPDPTLSHRDRPIAAPDWSVCCRSSRRRAPAPKEVCSRGRGHLCFPAQGWCRVGESRDHDTPATPTAAQRGVWM